MEKRYICIKNNDGVLVGYKIGEIAIDPMSEPSIEHWVEIVEFDKEKLKQGTLIKCTDLIQAENFKRFLAAENLIKKGTENDSVKVMSDCIYFRVRQDDGDFDIFSEKIPRGHGIISYEDALLKPENIITNTVNPESDILSIAELNEEGVVVNSRYPDDERTWELAKVFNDYKNYFDKKEGRRAEIRELEKETDDIQSDYNSLENDNAELREEAEKLKQVEFNLAEGWAYDVEELRSLRSWKLIDEAMIESCNDKTSELLAKNGELNNKLEHKESIINNQATAILGQKGEIKALGYVIISLIDKIKENGL